MTLPCIICDKELDAVAPEFQTNQPYDAVSFIAYGQYGSTVFDPCDGRGTYLEVNICDECLIKKRGEKKILFADKKTNYSKDVTDTVVDYWL
jgi:hypothetical protein